CAGKAWRLGLGRRQAGAGPGRARSACSCLPRRGSTWHRLPNRRRCRQKRQGDCDLSGIDPPADRLSDGDPGRFDQRRDAGLCPVSLVAKGRAILRETRVHRVLRPPATRSVVGIETYVAEIANKFWLQKWRRHLHAFAAGKESRKTKR